jgi:hypothetical protein
MTEKDLYHIISDYSQMSVDSLIELKNLVEDYPYCQTAQILYLLNLKRLGEDTFDTRLPYTAIYVHNRQKLKSEVEKTEEILAKKIPVGAKHVLPSKVNNSEKTNVKQILRSVQDDHKKSFRTKTISELLNLQKPKPESLVKTKKQNNDDKLLEQLRLEALAKVNDRLDEARKTMATHTNFSETPSRMAAAQDLIDKVIATNPRISKVDDSDAKLNKLSHWKFKEEHSLREDFELVSETLAQLYIAQGAHVQAREIYKTLSKTHPEKADYFIQLSKQVKTHSRASQDKQNKTINKKTKQ